ncbi:MAG TPA: hypothetical protein VGJ20_36080 [Xanthobacteraceae bacterium]|jgi:hypothetical protein
MGTYAIRALRRPRLMIGGRLFVLAIQLTTMRDAAARAVLGSDQPLSSREQRTIAVATSRESFPPIAKLTHAPQYEQQPRLRKTAFCVHLECFRSDRIDSQPKSFNSENALEMRKQHLNAFASGAAAK